MSTDIWEPPRTNRRRVKRRQMQAGDGWTVVTHSSSTENSKDMSKVLRDAQPTGVIEGLTVEKLLEEFRKMQSIWRDTECKRNMEELLGKRKWDVKEAVCLGTGSFSVDWEHRWRSLWQLVLFLDVVRILASEGPQIELFAQEPVFNPLDKSFLKALSITVLSSNAQTHMTTSSFLFAPFVAWSLLLPTFLKDRNPELYIGNEILDGYTPMAKTEEKEKISNDCNEIGRKFIEGRRAVRVPEFMSHAHALNGLMVYWKEGDEEG